MRVRAPSGGPCWTFRDHAWQSGEQGEEGMGMGRRGREGKEREGGEGKGREGRQVATEAGLHPCSRALCPAAYVLALSTRQDEKQVPACQPLPSDS